ncbi:hypothetical protein C0991_000464 [Blastosporella zonata]|nr:hypothetical protein C0991_000464 [Blastosporella zonata]
MRVTTNDLDEIHSSPDFVNLSIRSSDAPTPNTHSGATSPTDELDEDTALSFQKKKKKKKPKKSTKAKEAAAQAKALQESDGRPPVLCISRNKHWRYISSYHGPWLQLPIELLESLLVLNLDPATLATAPESRHRLSLQAPETVTPISVSASKQRDRGHYTLNECLPTPSPQSSHSSIPQSHSFPPPRQGKATPPPIDPGVFRSVTCIRRLIDEAAELSVRAASGLSAAELGSSRSGSGLNNSSWTAASSFGLNSLGGGGGGGGRSVAMSAMRIHRLRALAVQKLAQAYRADEIASSVMVMQGGSVFEDVAERVLKHGGLTWIQPTWMRNTFISSTKKYLLGNCVRFLLLAKLMAMFRQLAESTPTRVLDELIAVRPQHLEYYRTRGIVHCFRDEYPQATKDLTYALKEARAVRKAKMHRNLNLPGESRSTKNWKRKKRTMSSHTNGQAPPDGTSAMGEDHAFEGADGEPLLLHPSALPEAPEPIEAQLLFLRGAAYLQQAIHLIEAAVLRLEEVPKVQSVDGAELRLCYLERGKYGGVEIGNPDGPLGKSEGAKLAAYREVLAGEPFREQITTLLRKCVRDHEKFLSHFDSLDSPNALHGGDIAHQMEYAFLLAESLRPGAHTTGNGSNSTTPTFTPPTSPRGIPAIFTTYHPLIVESHFSVLLAQLMLCDFVSLLPTFTRTAAAVEGLEGYPVFLPPRSMGQAEFMEVLERLAGGWAHGTKSHSMAGMQRGNGKGRLAIEGPHSTALVHPIPYSPKFSTLDTTGSSSSRKNSNAHANGESSSGPRSGSVPLPPPPSSANGSFGVPPPPSVDGTKTLDCARVLLAPVAKRQRLRAEKAEKAAKKNGTGTGAKKPSTISIPLHGPRVEVVLAWLGAVHLPELEEYP